MNYNFQICLCCFSSILDIHSSSYETSLTLSCILFPIYSPVEAICSVLTITNYDSAIAANISDPLVNTNLQLNSFHFLMVLSSKKFNKYKSEDKRKKISEGGCSRSCTAERVPIQRRIDKLMVRSHRLLSGLKFKEYAPEIKGKIIYEGGSIPAYTAKPVPLLEGFRSFWIDMVFRDKFDQFSIGCFIRKPEGEVEMMISYQFP